MKRFLTGDLVAVLLVAAILCYTSLFEEPFESPKAIVFYGAGSIVFVLLALRRKIVWRYPTYWFGWVALAFCIWILFLALWNPQAPRDETLPAAARWIFFFLLVAVAGHLRFAQHRRWIYVLALSSAGIAVSHLAGIIFAGISISDHYLNFYEPIGHFSYSSELLSMALIGCAFCLTETKSKRMYFSWYLLSIPISVNLYLMFARSSLLATFIVLSFGMVYGMRSKLPRFALNCGVLLSSHLLLLLLLGGLGVKNFRQEKPLERVERVFTELSDVEFLKLDPLIFGGSWLDPAWFYPLNRFSSNRLSIYYYSLEAFWPNQWWGWGPGTFRFNYLRGATATRLGPHMVRVDTWVDHPHNEVLNQLAETGVVGTFLLLTLTASILLRSLRNIHRPAGKRSRVLAICMAMLFMFFLIVWQLDTSFSTALTKLLAILVIGQILGLGIKPTTKEIAYSRFQKVLPAVILVPCLYVIGCYELSNYFAAKSINEMSPVTKLQLLRRAEFFSARSFSNLLAHSQAENLGYLIRYGYPNALLKEYPFVPISYFEKGVQELKQGHNRLASEWALRTLRVDPYFEPATALLEESRQLSNASPNISVKENL